MKDVLLRFLIGGTVVSAFAMLGVLFKPKSFAGLFGAAPSVAVATLSLTIARSGRDYAALEARSMIAGSIGFLVYASLVSWVMMHHQWSALVVTAAGLVVWAVTAWGVWWVFLH
jgi:hypothetical protein